jgi:hypothetical protein
MSIVWTLLLDRIFFNIIYNYTINYLSKYYDKYFLNIRKIENDCYEIEVTKNESNVIYI